MRLELRTLNTFPGSTLGALYIDGTFECFTLEDPVRDGEKVWGRTAIPEGVYDMDLRKGSPMARRYDKRYSRFLNHDGMLWLRNVPNFKWIYIHPGNYASDTEGCILVGDTVRKLPNANALGYSRDAYRRLYPKIMEAIESGLRVTIEVVR